MTFNCVTIKSTTEKANSLLALRYVIYLRSNHVKFRPCIDIHNGAVKQIVGGSLRDGDDHAKENFVSKVDADFYAGLYRDYGLRDGHIILLNPKDSPYYEEDLRQARLALEGYPNGFQIGGGVNTENAAAFLDMGASRVIVTSFVFKDGRVNMDNLKAISSEVGKERLVLDLSCRKKADSYYIVTDRWQNFTEVKISFDTLSMFSEYCSEYLIHAVDVEGKAGGIEEGLASLLGEWGNIPITYAGGIGGLEDLFKLKALGKGKLDVTIGSALDIFGGTMKISEIINAIEE